MLFFPQRLLYLPISTAIQGKYICTYPDGSLYII